MKTVNRKRYKRKLSCAALAAMARGGRNGTPEDKRRAGREGWKALCEKLKGV